MCMYENTYFVFTTEPLTGCIKLGVDEVLMLFLGQIRPGQILGGTKIGYRGVPSSKNFFFRQEGYSNKPDA